MFLGAVWYVTSFLYGFVERDRKRHALIHDNFSPSRCLPLFFQKRHAKGALLCGSATPSHGGFFFKTKTICFCLFLLFWGRWGAWDAKRMKKEAKAQSRKGKETRCDAMWDLVHCLLVYFFSPVVDVKTKRKRERVQH